MYILPRSLRNVCNSVFVAAACILQRVTNHSQGTASSLREEQDVLCSAAYLGSASQLLRPFVGTDRDCGGISVPTENNSFCYRCGVLVKSLFQADREGFIQYSTSTTQMRSLLVCLVHLLETHTYLLLQIGTGKRFIYRPGRALRVPEVEAARFQDSRHMRVVRLSVVRTGRLYPQEVFPVGYSLLLEA